MSESQTRTIRKRNPGMLQSDEEVREHFVVRKHELVTVLEILRANIDADSCQHTLIVAPRGRGKTMLLARVAAELRADEELAGYLLPVRFMEESDEVFGVADFWLEALFYLALAIDKQDPELARNLRATRDDLSSRWRERELDERARSAVLEVADMLGKRLVLMVENLQALCANADDDFGWKLRKTLQTEPQIILVATATSRFEGLHDAREPFFELFRIICLAPLSTVQCRRLWEVASGDAASEREMRPLEILTGGSPRFLVIVAGFARHRSLRRLMEELVQLVDDLTDTFRGDLQELPKTERRVFLAIADLWQPSTTGEIADRARMDVRTVSTMLGRLVERGAVVWSGTGRKRFYDAAERLYSIYYKLRREHNHAAVVQGLFHFMAGFYTSSEFAKIFEELLINKGSLHGELGDHVSEMNAYRTLIDRNEASRKPELQAVVVRALLSEALALARYGDHAASISTYDRVVVRYGSSDVSELRIHVARALFHKAAEHGALEQHAEAIAAIEDLLDRYGNSDDPELREVVAQAMNMKGAGHGLLDDPDATIATSDTVIDCFGRSRASALQVQVAVALFHKGMAQVMTGRVEEAVKTSEDLDRRSLAAADDGRYAFKWRACHLRMSSLLAQGNHASAVDAFCSFYAAFLPDNETMVPELVDAVATLVAAGVPEREIIAILRSEPRKETVVAPLIIALRQRDGETVRAPAEVLEVAADVRQRIDETEMPLPAASDEPVSESKT